MYAWHTHTHTYIINSNIYIHTHTHTHTHYIILYCIVFIVLYICKSLWIKVSTTWLNVYVNKYINWNELIDYKWVFSHESYTLRSEDTQGGNETAHSETHMHVHTCTNSWNSKQLACMQPTERFLRVFALCFQLCKHKCQSLCKRANKMALSVYPLLIVLHHCTVRKQLCKWHSLSDVSQHGRLQFRPWTLKRSEW